MRKEDLRLAAGLTTNMIANMGKGCLLYTSGKAKLKCTVRDFEEVRQAVAYLKAHSLNTIKDLDTAKIGRAHV